jgi:dTDP-4-dehydrorhamnose reductase
MKTRVLITGITGMLGSEVFMVGIERGYDVYGTARRDLDDRFPPSEFPRSRVRLMQATQEDIVSTLEGIRPQAVINCLGVIKQATQDPDALYTINRDFAHALADACTQRGIRLVEVSTDCVFSGKKGEYTETDTPDPVDDYGQSKVAGEIYTPPHLTVRTSIIGFERGTKRSLIEWFLSNPPGSTLQGYTHAIWSGLTTRALAPILYDLAIGAHRDVTGLLHVASDPISKHDLLQICKRELHHDVTIAPVADVRIDRSLRHDRMDALGIIVPSHEAMIAEMARIRPAPQDGRRHPR